ncbi:MAG TPA: S8 family peptidase, partial [Pyrinomonadaceae bacterium]|nr:S8 family peptidase [Pyrinomonadaceae bacterium]
MRNRHYYRAAAWFTLLALLASIAPRGAAAGWREREPASSSAIKKISPDLRAKLDNPQPGERINVIIQFNESNLAPDALLYSLGAGGLRKLHVLNANVLSLPLAAVTALATRSEVRYISLDRQTVAAGHVTTTTGADAVRVQTSLSLLGLTTTYALDGTGIGIAVVDSGIDQNHKAFSDQLGLSRIIVNQDFTGEGRTDDPYGHGTHVASAAAGSGQIFGGAYEGVAPNAKLINLRVLNSQGAGTTSSLLAALDWVMTNRLLYNIRVVNISLGTTAVDSYHYDPVCQAVRRLVDAGVVVIAAAGNNGRDSSGNKIYGQIHSPGDEPSAITVGASNTFGTDARSDDAITTYSSRGPTRGHWADESGVQHYDNLIKPDLVAPGNRVIWAESANNYLVSMHPELDANVSSSQTRRMMYLSGTSMATPVVAGAAALLLQINSTLTPNMVKVILGYTAQPLAGFNQLEQGAGEINLEGAVR